MKRGRVGERREKIQREELQPSREHAPNRAMNAFSVDNPRAHLFFRAAFFPVRYRKVRCNSEHGETNLLTH